MKKNYIGWAITLLSIMMALYIAFFYDADIAGKIYLLIVCTFIMNLGIRILSGRGIIKSIREAYKAKNSA